MAFKRIMIFGRSGSGKSTFAWKLHEELGYPLTHLDRYYFIENWIKRDTGEFMKLQQGLVAEPRWIIDGTQISSLETRYQRADACVYFNYPFWRCLLRILKRRFLKDPRILDRPPACREQVSWLLLRYTWGFRHRVREVLPALRHKYPDVVFLEVTDDKQLPELMQGLCTKQKKHP